MWIEVLLVACIWLSGVLVGVAIGTTIFRSTTSRRRERS